MNNLNNFKKKMRLLILLFVLDYTDLTKISFFIL